MSLSSIFQEKPKTWGFRGDPYFWDYLADKANQMEMFSNPNDLEKWIKDEYRTLSREELTETSSGLIEEFMHGGMSSGRIAGEWWIQTGIPLLQSRLN